MPRPVQHRFSQELPQLNELWHVAISKMRAWVAPPGEIPIRPWVILVINGTTGLVQNATVAPAYPQPGALLELLQQTMQKRDAQLRIKPHRPTQIYLEDEALTTGVTAALAAQGIRVETVPRPEPVNEILAEMSASMSQGPEIAGLLAAKGVTPALAGDLFAAAAAFYRAEPWNYVTDQHPILVDAPQLGRKRFVIVMGAGGVEYGLAAYDQWKDVERLYSGGDPMEHIPAKGAHALHFNPVHHMAFDDLDALEQYGWEVADPEAHPMPMTFTRQQEVRRPDLRELQWYVATLRAIPQFVRDHLKPDGQGDFVPAQTTLTVPLVEGEMTVQLTYPAGKMLARELRPADTEWFGPEAEPVLPDRRGMEGTMAHFFGPAGNTPLDQAQELMYQAWDERNPQQRLALARKALKTSPDCADAYVLLAEEEVKTAGEALALYEQGMAAGERALGPAFFAENVGHFWGLIESRPYMRARHGLASTLWQIGRKEEASQHYRELLRLNPGDNQGVRYSLLNLLLELDKVTEANKLIKEYDDDAMAEWCYTHALLLFRELGAGKKADAALRKAIKQNKHVPAYLTGRKKIPVNLPPYIGFGDDNEASTYASSYLKHWRKTPGAVDWLKRLAK